MTSRSEFAAGSRRAAGDTHRRRPDACRECRGYNTRKGKKRPRADGVQTSGASPTLAANMRSRYSLRL